MSKIIDALCIFGAFVVLPLFLFVVWFTPTPQ